MTPEPDPRTDRTVLSETQYGTGANLASRANIYRWQHPEFDFIDWVLDQYRWQRGERTLDVGCGYGAYLPGLRRRAKTVTAIDLSMGMLREAADKGVPVARADAQQVPLATGAFDVTVAPHILYHLPDIRSGVSELRRVVRPGGTVLAATNASDDKPELMSLLHTAAGRPKGTYAKVDSRFLLDDGPSLFRQAFDHIRVAEVRTELMVPEVGPLIRYLDSTRSAAEPAFGVDWSGLLAAAPAIAQPVIDRTGAFRITTHAGVIVAE